MNSYFSIFNFKGWVGVSSDSIISNGHVIRCFKGPNETRKITLSDH